MKGTVLARPTADSGTGIIRWLDLWEQNSLGAIGSLSMMGDRDSYLGHYLRYILEKHVIREEVETAMLQWLQVETWSTEPLARIWIALLEVFSAAEMCRFEKVLTWLVSNFDRIYDFDLPADPQERLQEALLSAVLAFADTLSREPLAIQRLWMIFHSGKHKRLKRKLFLFLYKRPGCSRNPAGDQYLCRQGKRVRRQRGYCIRAVREGRMPEEYADLRMKNEVMRLRSLLYSWFMPRRRRGIGQMTEGEMASCSNKVKQWMTDQGIEVPIM